MDPILGYSNLYKSTCEPVKHIIKSDRRRAKMNRLIRTLCDEKYKHLVPILSMRIRWNTVLFEIDRGLKLKPVSAYILL